MITSDKQYTAAKKQLAMLTKSLSSPMKKNVPDAIEKAGKAQLQELINEIQLIMKEYKELQNCKPSDIEIHSLDDLMVIPIRYRIAAHMSVDAFSRKVGVSARQIARYERENYQNTNSSTLRKILGGLNIHLDGKIA
ncbi:MAG: helix-turn-helix transcriptional regulator [Pseudomonadales bacterium]